MSDAYTHVNQLAKAALEMAAAVQEQTDMSESVDAFRQALGNLGLSHVVTVEAEDPVSQLVRLRHMYGLTQRQVADMMGCSNAYLSRLENGERSGKGVERVRALLVSGMLEANAPALLKGYESRRT